MVLPQVKHFLLLFACFFIGRGLSQATECEREHGRHCHKWAQCERRQEDPKPRCYCSPGYGGDGYNCHRGEQRQDDSKNRRCPQPANIAHGSFTASDGSYRHGTVVTYRCRDEYRPQGPSQRTCQQNAQWSGSEPRCERHECKGLCQRPQNLDGGTMTLGKNCGVGSRVSYKCNEGLMLVGSSERTCKGDGQWTGSHPICEKATDCEREQGKHCHRWAQCERRQEDRKPRCYCSPGFSGDGYNCHESQQDECQRRNHQTCHAHADCVRVDENTYRCKCRDGYKGDGIYCEGKGCDKPSGLTDGRILTNQKRFVRGNVITYQCDRGYKLMGGVQRTCLEDGRWTGNEPRCERMPQEQPERMVCPRPQDIQHASVTASDWNFLPGATVTYQCRRPYKINGNSQRTCQHDGQWSGSKPNCQKPRGQGRRCQRPQDIPNGNIRTSDETYKPRTVITYECQHPYKLMGNSQRTCLGNGKWTGSSPKCEEDKVNDQKQCKRPPDHIPHARISVSDYQFRPGTVVTYTCEKGWRLQGSARRTCLDDEKWTGNHPRCQKDEVNDQKQCNRPPDHIPHGRISVSDYQFRPGTVVTYTCEKGWRLQGSARRTCQNDKRWTGNQPRCQRVQPQQKNECQDRCHANAQCRTEEGQRRCVCQPPYFGDGYYCRGCEGGQVYRECVTKCQPTCDNPRPVCDTSCDLNIKCICPDGKIQRSASDKTCVDRNQCTN